MSKKKPRILVADDDAFIRRPLEWILLQEGFEAETAGGVSDFLVDQPIRPLLRGLMAGAAQRLLPGREG